MLQDVLRRREPSIAIGAEQGQRTERCLDQATQAVVAQRLQDWNGKRIAQLAERDDGFFLGRKAGAAEFGHHGRKILGPRRQRGQDDDQCARCETKQVGDWIGYCASFETPASQAPQDDVLS